MNCNKTCLDRRRTTVVTFNDSLNAYESLEKGLKPDVILVDLKMPGMNGKELVEKMRANPELDFIPVTFITGSIPSAEILPSKDFYHGLILKLSNYKI
ncbi:response regulator [Desulfosporosinus nitroreducens]|uniref:response regulator n=1 Tax=Desulfosporosinus nitroreducens TaxID=2018668 RepID=UPI002852BD1F|nr:response regulator [Desulfosporosinus nitroreducens]